MYWNKLFFASLICLLSFSSQAQKCEVKTDPISGEKVTQFSNAHQTIKYEYKGGNLIDFQTTFTFSGEQNVTFPAESIVFFKLNTGKILSMKSIREAVPQTKVYANQYGATVLSNYTFSFQLTKEELKTLASGNIIFMRTPNVSGGTMDYEMKKGNKKFAKKITSGAQCMHANLSE